MLAWMPAILHFLSGDALEVQEDVGQVRGAMARPKLNTIQLTDKLGLSIYVNPSHVESLHDKREPNPPKMP
jgi:hypothetical protein